MESEEKNNPVLTRILEEIKSAKSSDSVTTAHNVYTSGVFEDASKDNDAKPN
jgi:hypothetical protein